jgi:putative PEP-CTERM system TPR-repeat lipoprotein
MNHPVLTSRTKGMVTSILLAVLLSACGGDKPEEMLASARDYLAKNDPKAAVIQLKNALQQNPDLPEARYLLGLALLRGGDAAGAETELRKALALKHPQELVLPRIAQAMLAQRQYKKLTDEFSKTELSQAAAQADLKTSLAGAQAAQGKADLAEAALKAALLADPRYAPALLLQARDKAARRDLDGALSTLEAIIAGKPTSHEAWKLKGDVLLYGKGNVNDGLAAYRKSVEIKPDYAEGHTAIMTTLMRQGSLDEATKQMEALKKLAPNSAQTRYFETLLAYQKKDFKLARDLSQQLMKMAPENTMSLQLAGAVELQANSLLQAETYLTKALQAAPEVLMVRRLLVTTYLRSGQPGKALAALQPALKNETADAATNSLAGEVYMQNGDTAKAEEYFSKAAKQDPKNTRARTSLALTHLASGRENAAFTELQDIASSDSGITADLALISAQMRRKEFDKALSAIAALEKKQPGKPLADNLRGRVLLAKQDTAGARKSFEHSVSIDPTYFPSVASLAALDMAEKKPDDARKRFEAVLAKDPKNGQALLALAELRARAGAKKEEVAELITRAVTANPTDKAPRLLLIDFHLRNKDFKLALSAAENAVAAIPDSPEVLDALGRAQQLSGDVNQALATYNKVATSNPTSWTRKQALSCWQSMRKTFRTQPALRVTFRSSVRKRPWVTNSRGILRPARKSGPLL